MQAKSSYGLQQQALANTRSAQEIETLAVRYAQTPAQNTAERDTLRHQLMTGFSGIGVAMGIKRSQRSSLWELADDNIQSAILGLTEALDHYRPERGLFLPFAKNYAKWSMRKAFADHISAVTRNVIDGYVRDERIAATGQASDLAAQPLYDLPDERGSVLDQLMASAQRVDDENPLQPHGRAGRIAGFLGLPEAERQAMAQTAGVSAWRLNKLTADYISDYRGSLPLELEQQAHENGRIPLTPELRSQFIALRGRKGLQPADIVRKLSAALAETGSSQSAAVVYKILHATAAPSQQVTVCARAVRAQHTVYLAAPDRFYLPDDPALANLRLLISGQKLTANDIEGVVSGSVRGNDLSNPAKLHEQILDGQLPVAKAAVDSLALLISGSSVTTHHRPAQQLDIMYSQRTHTDQPAAAQVTLSEPAMTLLGYLDRSLLPTERNPRLNEAERLECGRINARLKRQEGTTILPYLAKTFQACAAQNAPDCPLLTAQFPTLTWQKVAAIIENQTSNRYATTLFAMLDLPGPHPQAYGDTAQSARDRAHRRYMRLKLEGAQN